MLLELLENRSFLSSWAIVYLQGYIFVMSLSSIAFYYYYWNPTYDMWQKKSCAQYPPASKVRDEIMQMNKGLLFSTLAPTLSIWLSLRGLSKGYGGFPVPWYQELGAQLFYWIILDFVEWLYHYGTHTNSTLWGFHKYHHTFPNPSPFAVIADEVVDQLVRSSPMLWIPFFLPLNLDLMFVQMAFVHYGYGTYLHSGYELEYPDAHHPVINTSYHHYCHHAVSIANVPYHCGFVLSIFDRMMGSVYTEKCFCCKCAVKGGERSIEKWKDLKKPNYNVILTPRFWVDGLKLEWQKMLSGTWVQFK